MTEKLPQLHTLHFNVTNSCNLSCSFCYIDAVKAKATVIPLHRVRTLAAEARSVGGLRVIVSGGETFMRNDWYELITAFSDEDFATSIVTNGTLLKASVVDRLSEVANLSVLVSLDGDVGSHDRIRGHRGAHDKTIRAIGRLRESGIAVQVNATIIRENVGDVAYLTKLSRDLDVSMRFSLLNPYNGRGQEVADAALGVNEVLALRDYCHDVRSLGSKVFINLPPLLLQQEDVLPMRSPSCGWTNSYCGVTYDGNVTICGVAGADATLHVGNIMEQSFADIWNSSPLFKYLRSLTNENLQGVCAKCKYKKECGGACRLSAYKGTGDFTASYSMCQAFYDADAVNASLLDEDNVPIVRKDPAPLSSGRTLLPLVSN